MRRFPIIAAVLLAGLAAAVGRASYLIGDGESEPVGPDVVPAEANPLIDAVKRLSVRPGFTYKGLTVYLLETSRVTDPTDYRSLSEALAAKVLTISEKGAGRVPTVLANNTGDEPVLMLTGEIIVGGKQNRTLRDDVLLPPRSGPIELPVLCVEKGRWSGRTAPFASKSSLAGANIRARAGTGRPQQEIWDSVGAYGEALKAREGVTDLQALQDMPDARKALADYRRGFRDCWRRGAVGMVVARHGRIAGADIFASPAVFAKHRDRLMDSYALDCYIHRNRLEGPERAREALHDTPQDFLARLYRARFAWRESPGLGRLLTFSGTIGGQALVRKDAVLHVAVFPEVVPVPIVRPVPPGPMPPIPIPMPNPRPGPYR